MVNKDLSNYINEICDIARKALNTRIYLPVKCDYDSKIDEQINSKINDFYIQEFVLEHIGKKYGCVYGDSHSVLKGCYKKNEIGTEIFCDKKNTQLALNNKSFEVSKETETLKNVFVKLEELQQKNIDNAIFCVLQDSTQMKYQVVVMEVYNIMISVSSYHYDKLIDNYNKFKQNGYLIACESRDSIGNFTAVLGERCFINSDDAIQKANELNKHK